MHKPKANNLFFNGAIVIIIIIILIGGYFALRSPWQFREDRPIKIFWINSYHSPWWPDEAFNSFEEEFTQEGANIVVRKFHMDTINNFSEEDKMDAGKRARELIEEWRPDLIYATDDPAQKYVIEKYYLDSDIPVVFSGVNSYPETYGYDQVENVAGVLERLHFVETVDALLQLFPHIETIAFFSDVLPQRKLVIERLKKQQEIFPNIDFVGWNLIEYYEDYKETVLYYQDRADAILFLGLSSLKDESDQKIERDVVSKWTIENNKLPEAKFRKIYVDTVLAVDVSAHEQGKAAGIIAKEILLSGKKPSSLEFKSTTRGDMVINLARAEMLGLKQEHILSSILINSEIIEEFPWEDERDSS